MPDSVYEPRRRVWLHWLVSEQASMLPMLYVAVAYFTAEDALTDSREKEVGALETCHTVLLKKQASSWIEGQRD